MKILVVEDEFVSRSKLKSILSNFGECVLATNGKEAITAFEVAWAKWQPFDLITLDQYMPEMDGIETLLQIRHRERTKGISPERQVKVFMITVDSNKDTLSASITAGCSDFIIKPFNHQKIEQKLTSVIMQNISFWEEILGRIK